MSLALFWSSGKDAAWTLHLLRQQGIEVSVLVTTFVGDTGRVTSHGVRRSVVRHQAAQVDLPLVEVDLPWPCSNPMYEFAVGSTLEDLKAREGIVGAAFGDLYLNDVREYRRSLLARYGLRAEFPLWGMRTDLLARRILRAGVEVYLASVDPTKLDSSFAGAQWTEGLVRNFPPTVDPCGENGEFHTVITDGPMFAAGVRVQRGDDFEDGAMVAADFEVAPESGR